MSNDPRVIVALDYPDAAGALALAGRLDPKSCRLKVGKELYTAAGPALVGKLVQSGFGVFLDLKYHDIPNTVASACAAAAGLGVWMINVHALGGRAMMSAAREALARTARPPKLIAVTILTSMAAPDLADIGLVGSPQEAVTRLARLTQACGLDGVVCSPQEAAVLRRECGKVFALVTPGIRPAEAGKDDQQRIATPRQAIADGADYLVIGRPITRAPDPLAALREINEEIAVYNPAMRNAAMSSAKDFKNARVLVVGDAMLDRYWVGEVDRISPEAPVPIVRIDHEEERPGGAANVARNAAALGARATLLSVVGADEPGARLESLLKRERVVPRLHHDRGIKTTVKLRVIAGRNQQLLRVDFETAPGHEVLASKLRDFEKMLGEVDAVILSDYGKGGLTHIVRMISLARRAGKPVLVDPKGDDYSRYKGATLITPNRSEFSQVAGAWKDERDLTERAQRLRRKLDAKALLVTRGGEGMTLFQEGGRLHVATQAREVSDVSGAGDTVIATLAVALASGARMKDAVRLANRAAGIVVGKFGTAVVTPKELFGK